MGFRSHVTYLLGNSLLKHWIVCCVYWPIIQDLESWACYFDLILWSESNVSFGPDLGFSYGMRVVNCSIIAAWSPASHIYWVQELNWPWSSSGLTWTEEEANDLVFLLGMDGWLIIFSFHFCYILHDRFWRNHINSLWLFIFVKLSKLFSWKHYVPLFIQKIHWSILNAYLFDAMLLAFLSVFSFPAVSDV